MCTQCVEFKFDVNELATDTYDNDTMSHILGSVIGNDIADQFIDFCFMVARTIKAIKDSGVEITKEIKINSLNGSDDPEYNRHPFSKGIEELTDVLNNSLIYNPTDNSLSWSFEM